jgi:hypothetical protein
MRTRSKLLLAALTATFVMAAAVGSASATRLATNNSHWRAIWASMTFKELGFAGATIRCRVTLEGSFHSLTISKVSGQLIGAVTRAIVDEPNCTGGKARALSEKLPWHVKYISFAGTLPSISSVKIALVGAQFLVEAFGFVSCLYTTSDARPARGIVTREAGGVATGIAAEGRISSNTGGCPEGEFSGSSGTVKNETETVNSTITLVA